MRLGILRRYVLRELCGPFVASLCLLTFVLIMNHLLKVFDMLLGRGVPLWAVTRLLLYMLPFTFALTVPMATLVATLMAFGRMSADSETVAAKTSGISLMRLMEPALGAAVLLAGAMAYFNCEILPRLNHRYAALYADISRKKPAVHIREGVFIEDFPGYHILIRSEDRQTGELRGITIYQDPTGTEGARTILAKRGRLEPKPEQDTITLRLFDGEIHEVDPSDPDRYLRLKFRTTSVHLTGLNLHLERRERTYKSDREMTLGEMRERIAALKEEIAASLATMRRMVDARLGRTLGPLWPQQGTGAEPAWGPAAERRFLMRLQAESQAIAYRKRDVNRYAVEIHKKFSIAASCIVFVLVGAPIGVVTRRGGLGSGLGISLVFFVVYYVFLIGGEELADRAFISPAVAMWAANVVVGLTGLYLVATVMLEWHAHSPPRQSEP